MILRLFYFFSFFLLQLLTKKITNIGYISYGYNIFLGNPNPTQYSYDPGLTFASIFDLEYTNNKTTSDGAYEIPDNLDAIESVACSYSTETSSIFGETSYMTSLENSVSISLSAEYEEISGDFSASYDWGRVSKETVQNNHVVVSTSARCSVFTVNFNVYMSYREL